MTTAQTPEFTNPDIATLFERIDARTATMGQDVAAAYLRLQRSEWQKRENALARWAATGGRWQRPISLDAFEIASIINALGARIGRL